MLQGSPGVRVTRGFGNFQEQYTVRGLPIFSDDMAYNGLYGVLPRQYIAAEFFERVEVLMGAGAFLNGAAPGGSGIGGAINLVPKRAPNQPLTQATIGTESGGQTYLATDIARRFGPDKSLGLRLNAVNRDGGTALHGEKRRLDMIAFGADYRSGALRVSADLGYQDHQLNASSPNVVVASGLAVPRAPGASRTFAQPWTRSSERDSFGTLRAEYDLGDEATAWTAAGLRRSDESNILANPKLTAAGNGTMSSYRFDNNRADAVATAELGLRATFATGGIKHTVSASVATFELNSKNAYAFSSLSGFVSNLYAPVTVLPPNPDALLGGRLDSPLTTHRVKTASAALADTMSVADGLVLLTLGGRHQRIEDITYDYATGFANEPSSRKAAVTPVAGLVVRVTPRVSAYANYIEGLAAAPIAPATTGSGAPVSNAGEVFAPYKSKQNEVGVKYDGGRIGGTLSAYQTRRPQGAFIGNTYGESAEQRNRGVEFSIFGEPIRGFRTLGGLSYADARFESTTAIGVPKLQANASIEWDVPSVMGLVLSGRVLYTGKQFVDQANTQVAPSWRRLDLSARYLVRLGSGQLFTLRARLDNATGHDYWASSGGNPGSSYIEMGAPRTFELSGSIDF